MPPLNMETCSVCKQLYSYPTVVRFQVCGEKASKELVVEVQALINGSELIFASYGKGKELDVFPFLRHFGNSTWKEIQRVSKARWSFFNNIVQKRKVVIFCIHLQSQIQ